MRSVVALVSCKDYSRAPTEVARALDLLGDLELAPDERVLLKPNLLQPSDPQLGIITHPQVIRGVIRYLKRYTSKLWIGDCPGTAHSRAVYQAAGIQQLAQQEGVELAIMEQEPPHKLNLEDGTTIWIAAPIANSDKILNLPKLKLHRFTGLTGAVKNAYGYILGAQKQQLHGLYPKLSSFCRVIAQLHRAFPSWISLMDGIIARETEAGPGAIKQVGVILASRDPVALDAVACQIVGLDPSRMPLLQIAQQYGVGCADLSKIELLGDPIQEFRCKFRPLAQLIPAGILQPIWALGVRFLRQVPKLVGECTRCGNCARICPGAAISLANERFSLDFSRCIGCFCCIENCPQQALGSEEYLRAMLRTRFPWIRFRSR